MSVTPEQFLRLADVAESLLEKVGTLGGQVIALQGLCGVLLAEAVRHAEDPTARLQELTCSLEGRLEKALRGMDAGEVTLAQTELMDRVIRIAEDEDHVRSRNAQR